MADNVDWDAVRQAMQDPEVAKVFQQAQEDPAVAQYLRDMQAQAQAAAAQPEPAATPALDPIFANPELQRQLQDPAVQDYMRAMEASGGPGGPTDIDGIKIPEGVVPTSQKSTVNTSGNSRDGQAYFTGVDMDGVTYHFYADGSKVRMDVPIVTAPSANGGSATTTATTSTSIGVGDISIAGGHTIVTAPDGSTITLPAGVSPDAQLWQNPNTGQWYATSPGKNGLINQYYADGSISTTGVGASFVGGNGANSAGDTGGTVAPVNDPVNSVTSVEAHENTKKVFNAAKNPLSDTGNTGGAVAPPTSTNPAGNTGGTAAPGAVHTVKKGDTMWDIARENSMDLGELIALNPHIDNPNLIHPGEKINLGAASAGAAAGAAFPVSSSYDKWSSNSGGQAAAVGSNEGWGTDAVPKDPATSPMQAMAQPNTDPLKIDDKKNAS